MNDNTVTKQPANLSWFERSVFLRNVEQQPEGKFEIGAGSGVDVTVYVIVGFQQKGIVNR